MNIELEHHLRKLQSRLFEVASELGIDAETLAAYGASELGVKLASAAAEAFPERNQDLKGLLEEREKLRAALKPDVPIDWLVVVSTVVVCIETSRRLLEREQLLEAIGLFGAAESGMGVLQALRHPNAAADVRAVMSQLGRSGASVRHAENYAMRDQVFEWCDNNMQKYRSMDSAANAVAGHVVPVVFRTARTWIGLWKKKQSSG